MRVAATVYMTPPELARLWGVSVKKVLGFVEGGELPAIDLATKRGGRPRWKISAEAIAQFELVRGSAPKPATPAPRRRKPASDSRVIQFV